MGKKFKYLDMPLLIVTVLLFIFGLVMVFSASNVTAYMSHARSIFTGWFDTISSYDSI